MDTDSFNSLRDNMAQANIGFKPPPVLDEVMNDKLIVAKNAVEGLGGQLTGTATLHTLNALSKSKKVLAKRFNMSEADIDKIAQSAAKGDLRGIVNNTTDAALKSASNSLQGAIGRGTQAIKATAGRVVPDAEPALADTQNSFFLMDDLDASELPSLSSTLVKVNQTAQDAADAAGGAARQIPSVSTASEITPFNPTAADVTDQAAAKAAAAATDALNIGKKVEETSKVVGDIKKATVVSEGADFDPVNLGITAALGLAGVIGGLFIKTHHTVNRAPPAILPINYGSQLF